MALPVVRPVGDTGLMFEFGTAIDPATHARVLAFDAALTADPPAGVRELVPAYASLLIHYDPLVTDAEALAAAALPLAAGAGAVAVKPAEHVIPFCADPDLGPDLAEAAERLGLSGAALVDAFAAASYRVYMYGFAPGYAYLDGVPAALHLPRKPVPVRSRPVGSVMIAGGQAIITTLPMPTGWWVLGQTRVPVLRPDDPRPFLFDLGDTVRFVPVSRAEFDA
jgi:inhibitor of KinA